MAIAIEDVIDNQILTDDDLVGVLRATVKVIDWKSLGLSLGIPVSVIDRIEVDCHRAMDCQRHMLQHWLNTGNASWAALVAALRSQLVSMNGLANTIAKEHHRIIPRTKKVKRFFGKVKGAVKEFVDDHGDEIIDACSDILDELVDNISKKGSDEKMDQKVDEDEGTNDEEQNNVPIDNEEVKQEITEKPPKQLSLTPLLPLSIDYKSAYEVFKQGWKISGTIPVPEQIYQVKNSETTAAYHKYLHDQLDNENDIIPQHFFFGGFLLCNLLESNTFCDFPECDICHICQNGFSDPQDEINIKCLFSKSSTGRNFTHGVEEIGLRAQLICLMAHEYSVSPTETCEEAVVNNPHSILVEFIVLYNKEGIDRLVN